MNADTASDISMNGSLRNASVDRLACLVRHWTWYAGFADCQVALVDKSKSPGQRTKPQRALPEELVEGGDNLWLHRLRARSICPTRLGPRPPSNAASTATLSRGSAHTAFVMQVTQP